MNFTNILRPVEMELWSRIKGVDETKLSNDEAEDFADFLYAHKHIMEAMESLYRFDSKLEEKI